MVSNFSRRLDAAELSALSKLDTLQISFDSSDREMVRNLRSKADLQTITYNIIRLRQVAHDAGRTPFILVNCVLSRDNIGHLADLAGFCRALGVNQLMICEVTPVSSVTPEKTKLLDALTDDEVILLARQIMDATAMLSEGPTSLLLRDHLKARIGDVIEQLSAGATPVSPAAQFHRSMVKSACPMPWTSPMVKANGRVIACCGPAFLDIGVLDGRQTLGDIVEGAKARAIRSAILDGRPTVGCETCTLVLPTSFSEFKHYIEGRYGCASTITGCSEEPKILSPSP
jgi:MoaA/NifB/PqqE/SkfB family radical SAM enzyme